MQTLLFTYFYFLNKDHQLAYFNMFMPINFEFLQQIYAQSMVGRGLY